MGTEYMECGECHNKQLTACGLYKTVRWVLDITGYFHMGTEYMECGECHNKQLTACGLYKTVRWVLEITGYFHMGTEYMECGECHNKQLTVCGLSTVTLGIFLAKFGTKSKRDETLGISP